ncbi:Mediator Of Dna Damage Checkpoint Protein 1 [Manis pentadactyla]|nr:Mediator Of Dna Damage Checkpoint Protein 1 [Manis pentadactyla]
MSSAANHLARGPEAEGKRFSGAVSTVGMVLRVPSPGRRNLPFLCGLGRHIYHLPLKNTLKQKTNPTWTLLCKAKCFRIPVPPQVVVRDVSQHGQRHLGLKAERDLVGGEQERLRDGPTLLLCLPSSQVPFFGPILLATLHALSKLLLLSKVFLAFDNLMSLLYQHN